MDDFRAKRQALLDSGVRMMDPSTVYVEDTVTVGEGTLLLPGTILRGNTVVGKNCEIGPNTMLVDCVVEDEVTINSSQCNESVIHAGAHVGPFAYIRPNCEVGRDVKVGDFVELKNSTIGDGTKISHLTYVGDRRRALWWAAAFCLVLTALQLVCLGNFGPGLTARMDTPFFMMVKGIGIEGTFQRVESVIIALWVFSDLALLNLLAGSCSVLAQSVFSLKERKHAVLPLLLLALAGAWFLFPDAFSLERWMEGPARIGSLLFGFVIPVLLLLVKKLRRQV